VTLAQLSSDSPLEEHQSTIYYVGGSPRVREIAELMAHYLRGLENFRVRQLPHPTDKFEFAVYFVTPTIGADPGIELPTSAPTNSEQKSESNSKKIIVECPKCPSRVRSDRLERHLAKPHRDLRKLVASAKSTPKERKSKKGKRRTKKFRRGAASLPQKNKVYFYDEAPNSMPTGPLFGTPGVMTWESPTVKSLRPRSGTRICRMCTRPAMYNSGECYLHNPK
jgi:hypothetical protein